MIDMRYKPRFLPQVSAPFDIVLQKLDEEGVGYDMVEVDPNTLNPSQGITFSDEVGKVNVDDMNPIWISDDMDVLDGHHRMVRAMLDEIPLKAVKIKANSKDASRILNKIQDIYEYEQAQGMEEVVGQDVINSGNEAGSSEFLASLEEDNIATQSENPSKNEQTVIAYRRDPIKENSVVGNFFVTKPIQGFSKYEIDFENLFDTHSTGVSYKDGQDPIDILSKVWFPHVNFEKLSGKYNVPPENLKNKAIAEKARSMGYDGIKFETIIWGLK